MPLRPLDEHDLDRVRSWRNAPEIRRHMYATHEISAQEHRAWFVQLQNDRGRRCLIFEDDNGVACGLVNFVLPKCGHCASWGFYAAPGAAPGTGTQIGLDALDLAFLEWNLHKLAAEVIADNRASLRLHDKLGFVAEGRFVAEYHDGEKYVDIVRLAIFSQQWRRRREELIATRERYGIMKQTWKR